MANKKKATPLSIPGSLRRTYGGSVRERYRKGGLIKPPKATFGTYAVDLYDANAKKKIPKMGGGGFPNAHSTPQEVNPTDYNQWLQRQSELAMAGPNGEDGENNPLYADFKPYPGYEPYTGSPYSAAEVGVLSKKGPYDDMKYEGDVEGEGSSSATPSAEDSYKTSKLATGLNLAEKLTPAVYNLINKKLVPYKPIKNELGAKALSKISDLYLDPRKALKSASQANAGVVEKTKNIVGGEAPLAAALQNQYMNHEDVKEDIYNRYDEANTKLQLSKADFMHRVGEGNRAEKRANRKDNAELEAMRKAKIAAGVTQLGEAASSLASDLRQTENNKKQFEILKAAFPEWNIGDLTWKQRKSLVDEVLDGLDNPQALSKDSYEDLVKNRKTKYPLKKGMNLVKPSPFSKKGLQFTPKGVGFGGKNTMAKLYNK